MSFTLNEAVTERNITSKRRYLVLPFSSYSLVDITYWIHCSHQFYISPASCNSKVGRRCILLTNVNSKGIFKKWEGKVGPKKAELEFFEDLVTI